MYYKLFDDIALRKWTDYAYSYYTYGARKAIPLKTKEAETMLLCDGEHDLETDDTVMQLILRNLITPEGYIKQQSVYRHGKNDCRVSTQERHKLFLTGRT